MLLSCLMPSVCAPEQELLPLKYCFWKRCARCAVAVCRVWVGLGLGVGLLGAAEVGASDAWVEESAAALASLFALASSFSLFCKQP